MKMTCAGVNVKERGCEDEKMICVDVKMRGCEDEKMICVYVKVRCVDVMMRRCEDVKTYNRPPLLEEPFPQTLSGIRPN